MEPNLSIFVDQVSEQIRALANRFDAGFSKLDSKVDALGDKIANFEREKMTERLDVQRELEAIRTDVAVFKARWATVTAAASILASMGASMAVHWLSH